MATFSTPVEIVAVTDMRDAPILKPPTTTQKPATRVPFQALTFQWQKVRITRASHGASSACQATPPNTFVQRRCALPFDEFIQLDAGSYELILFAPSQEQAIEALQMDVLVAGADAPVLPLWIAGGNAFFYFDIDPGAQPLSIRWVHRSPCVQFRP